VALITQNLPRIWYQLKLAQSQGGEPTAMIWLSLIASCLAVLVAGTVLALAILVLVLVEGTQILVDELGISVDCVLLPAPLARKFGAGRLQWKNVAKIERRIMSFVLHEHKEPSGTAKKTTVKFFVVDHMDRLIYIIIERSPNLNLSSK
jgi:hypothetical protein